jgi:radical SAM superfamily enzyme YgiQ (UPF0313 family)
MRKVILVNASTLTAGYSFFTPRWLFVIAQATPVDLVGDPIIVDEAIEKFDPAMIRPGDIVGLGITSGNCIPAYRIIKESKTRGAIVIAGGIHSTIFPEEPLEMGADSTITGNGDVVWAKAVHDALDHKLKKHYVGGRIPGDAMVKARWDLVDASRYLFATVQTVAGCPENCSFCSVWVTDGRVPRQRLADKIIEEVNELYNLGFRYVAFADDNFSPATLPRIAREQNIQKRKEFERIREERLSFFDEYDRKIPKDMFAITQMTSEVASDAEYFSAMYHKMRIRAGLIGVESFSKEGLAIAAKSWNPAGEEMIDTIRKIQESGILVLSSIICGLESDTPQTIAAMREFARDSGTLLAQFTYYSPYPGTKDYYEMMGDNRNREKPNFTPKHRVQILRDRFWLTKLKPPDIVKHPNMSRDDWITENKKCWDTYYSLRETLKRVRSGPSKSWPLAGKITYVFACLAFRRVYAGHGISADSVRKKELGVVTRTLIRVGVAIHRHFSRRKKVGLRVSLRQVG